MTIHRQLDGLKLAVVNPLPYQIDPVYYVDQQKCYHSYYPVQTNIMRFDNIHIFNIITYTKQSKCVRFVYVDDEKYEVNQEHREALLTRGTEMIDGIYEYCPEVRHIIDTLTVDRLDIIRIMLAQNTENVWTPYGDMLNLLYQHLYQIRDKLYSKFVNLDVALQEGRTDNEIQHQLSELPTFHPSITMTAVRYHRWNIVDTILTRFPRMRYNGIFECIATDDGFRSIPRHIFEKLHSFSTDRKKFHNDIIAECVNAGRDDLAYITRYNNQVPLRGSPLHRMWTPMQDIQCSLTL
jgi:hypothetical protein